MSFRLILEGQPVSKKNGWRFGGGRVFSDPIAKAYSLAIKFQAKTQMNSQGAQKIGKPAKVALRIAVYFGPRQRMDVHNAVETVLDALQQVCYDDDNQVVGLYTPPLRLIDEKRPRVELEVFDAAAAANNPMWGPR